MKKLFMILMAVCLIAPMATAELTKKQEKTINRMAKERSKKLEKDGFAVMGSVPLKAALVDHYTALENGALEQVGTGRSKSKNTGRQMCLTYAMSEYASKALSQIKGRSVTDGYGNEIDTENDEEFARFYAAYERLTQKEIKGEMQESFTVYRQLPDGTYEFEMYLTVDGKNALDKRKKAISDAAAESNLAQDYARQISEFVSK